MLNQILAMATVTDINHSRICTAVNDTAFSDFEDSIQYECALKAECDMFVTLNTKDFKNVDVESVKIVTPELAVEIMVHQ